MKFFLFVVKMDLYSCVLVLVGLLFNIKPETNWFVLETISLPLKTIKQTETFPVSPPSSELPSSSSSSRCCRGCSDSSSSPPCAQPWCDDTPPPWSPTKTTAPHRTPTPTGPAQTTGRCHPSPATALWWRPPRDNVTTWPTIPTSCGCSTPPARQYPPFLIRRSATCCWTHRYQYLWTRFLLSASVCTVRAPWGPKETVGTGALQVCRTL